MKITDNRRDNSKTFGKTKIGELFEVNGDFFIRVPVFYKADEITREINNEHDLTHSDDICSNEYNAIEICSGKIVFFNEFDEVIVIEAELIVTNGD